MKRWGQEPVSEALKASEQAGDEAKQIRRDGQSRPKRFGMADEVMEGVYDLSLGGLIKPKKSTQAYLISCAHVGHAGGYTVCVGPTCQQIMPTMKDNDGFEFVTVSDQIVDVEVIGMTAGYAPLLVTQLQEVPDGKG